MSVTQQDIANKLNLSRSLVAGVLNNKPGVWASEHTRQRIQHAAREMNYRPHAAARALRSGKTHTISFHELRQPEDMLPSQSIVIESLAQFAAQNSQWLLVSILNSRERFLQSLNAVATARSSDVAVLWGHEDAIEEGAELLGRFGVPFVLKGYFDGTQPQWPQIDFDHVKMMIAAVECLKSLGHRRIAYFGHDTNHTYAVRLREGFARAIEHALGRPPNPKWIVQTSYRNEIAASIRNWLTLPQSAQPTAFVIGTNDECSWLELEVALGRAGKRLGVGPNDYAGAGLRYNNTALLFGQAYTFSGTDLGELMQHLCSKLLLPLIEGSSPAEPVLRILPDLALTESFDLLNIRSREWAGDSSFGGRVRDRANFVLPDSI